MFSSHIDLIDFEPKYLYNSFNSFSPIHSELENEFMNLNTQLNILNEHNEDIFDNDSFNKNNNHIFNQKNENKNE